MTYQETYQQWLASPALSPAEKAELTAIAGNDKEIESRFFGPLEFGTAGLRGTMAVGLHHMNIHVIRHATQAFAEVILEEGPQQAARGIAICCDCRNQAYEFAMEAASIMAGNGIPSRIFDALRPTPELSFAVREYDCIAGINVTASHNPKEYNGYKVYWAGGAQLPPKQADGVAQKMAELDLFNCVKRIDFNDGVTQGLITVMGEETDKAFMANVMAQAVDTDVVAQVADTFKMVFTPFHGTGYRLIPEALKNLGIKHLYCEEQQMVVDGNFPTVVSPNPENPEGFALSVALAKEAGADFILGSDPDADRVGIMVRASDGEYVTISGNQTGVLLLDYLIHAMKRKGTLPEKAVALKTIVTTQMAYKVATVNGLTCYDTFTGFKFLAEKKDELESTGQGTVIMSYEESYGYMLGDYVRDKDAVSASLLLTEMAAWYYSQGTTLYEALQALYEKYGYYNERTLNLVMPGLDGLRDMAKLMANLRANPPKEIGGLAVAEHKDYLSGTVTTWSTGAVAPMELSGSNVLRYEMTDGTSLIVRPSGTEPKVKVYILTQGQTKEDCQEKITLYSQWAEGLKNLV